MKVGDKLIIQNKSGGCPFDVGVEVVLINQICHTVFEAESSTNSGYVSLSNFTIPIKVEKVRLIKVRQINKIIIRISTPTSILLTKTDGDLYSSAMHIFIENGIVINSYSELKKGGYVFITNDLITEI